MQQPSDQLYTWCISRSHRTFAVFLGAAALLTYRPIEAQQIATPVSFAAQSNGNFGGAVPIHLPPGTGGLAPSLAISYSSHSPNGLLGLGFSLQGLSAITRCARTQAQDGSRGSVNYDMNDRYCLDGQRLVPVNGSYSNYGTDGFEYRTELDSFSQIISHGSTGNGPTYFTVRTKSGMTETFGNTADSGVVASGISSIRTWALSKVMDGAGNYYTVTYTDDTNGAYYPSVINYTGNGSISPQNSVTFGWQTRTDPIQSWTKGSGVKIVNRLASIQVTAATQPVRLYSLTYDNGASGGSSRLKQLQECAANNTTTCMPAVTFTWQGGSAVTQTGTLTPQPDGTQIGAGGCLSNGSSASPLQFPVLAGGFTGSGRTDFLCDDSTTHWKVVYVSNGNGTFSAPFGPWPSSTTPWCAPNLAPNQTSAYTGANLLLQGDFNGDGLQDMACIGFNPTQTLVYVGLSNGAGAFTQPQSSWAATGACIGATNILTGDFDGDGRTDLLCIGTSGNASYSVELSQGDGTFAAPTTTTWSAGGGGWCSNPHVIVADFNGDGKSDLLCNNPAAGQFEVAFSNGDGSFTVGPLFSGWCTGGSVSVADVNGDGKADLICTDTSNKQTVAFSKGDGTFQIAAGGAWPTGSAWCAASGSSPTDVLRFADLNGDGKADMICNTVASVPNQGSTITVAYSNGDGTFSAPGGSFNWCGNLSLISGDVTGDGATDLACFGGTITATALAIGTPDLVIGFNNGLSAPSVPAVTAAFQPITNSTVFTKASGDTYPIQDVVGPYYVVSSVARANGIGGVLTTNYNYAGLKIDLSGRGSLGFGTVTSTDAQTSIVSSTVYNQAFPYTGLPATASTTLAGQGSGGLLKSVANTYQCYNPATGAGGTTCPIAVGNRYFPALQQSVTTSYDLNGAALPTSTTTIGYDTTYAFFGNVKTVTTSNTDGYTKTTTNTYNAPDLTHWWLGQVNETQVTSTTP
jgi:hypothetical protein